ncbi:MAG: CHAT domain-containing protein [Nostocales cyanobacterium 94392]|nr:CHAT domain-containing protein [Nostocales cyanobacterium 94392]
MAMGSGKVGLSVLVCLLVIFSTSLGSSFLMVTESLVLAQTVDAQKVEADRLLEQGYDQLKKNQLEAALQSFQKALIICRKIKNLRGEGFALFSLGFINFGLQDDPKAIDYYKQSLVIARKINDSKLETLVQMQIMLTKKRQAGRLLEQGYEQHETSQFQAALLSWEKALQIYREIKDRQGEGTVLGSFGIAYRYTGDYPKAINYQQQSLVIAKEIKDRLGEANALGNLGNVYDSLGDYPKAIEYQQQSLVIAKEIKYRKGEANALGNLGNVYDSLGDYPKAIDYHQQHLEIAREIKHRKGEGNALGNLGLAYLYLGDYPKSIEYQQQRLEIAREIKDRQGEGQSLGNLGIAYVSLGDYSKAIKYQQQTLDILREIKDRQGEGAALANLGNAYSYLEDYPKAIEYHQQHLRIAREIKDRQGEGQSRNNLGVVYYRQGNLALAESTLIEGIKVRESLRGRELKDNQKVSIFDKQSNTYRTLQQVLIAQNKTDAALEIAERGRGRAFVELLASRLSTNSQEKFPTPPNIAEIKKTAQSQNAILVQYSVIYDEFKITGKQKIKESELYIWVIKPTGEVIFRKADLKALWQKENTSLTQLINNTRDSMGVVDISRGHGALKPAETEANTQTNQTQNLKQLHKLLIQPIAKHLPNNPNEKVIFIPQESLFLAPFPALQDEKGKYLIEKHTILTAPSIQVLDLTRQQKLAKPKQKDTSPGQSLIVGNPTMPITSLQPEGEKIKLPPLKGAEKEAITIASLPLLNSKPLIGDAATETSIVAKMPQAKYIHLATHGLFDDIRGLGSAIALAPSNQDDGLLTAEEIFNFKQKLKADLVVLSACDTGRGKITGDGVIGLSRSFISAGVPSVIVSLWSVDDGSTAFLMTKFYQNLERNPDKAKALREAMLETKKKYSQPLQWAAFTLIGESE